MKLVKLLNILLLLFSLQAKAADDEVGIGAILGNPTGASGHMRLDDKHFLAGALAYNFAKFPGLHLSVDYLWDNTYEFDIKTAQWNVYYGVGGRIISVQSGDDKNKIALGVRAPVGTYHTLRDPHIMIFGEIAPVLNLAPSSDVGFDLGIGFRILF